MHISEEASEKTEKEVRESTISTFLAKLMVGSSFLIPILALPLDMAVLVSIAWGVLIIAVLSYFIAKRDHKSPLWTITEHIALTIFIILLTHGIGSWISGIFA